MPLGKPPEDRTGARDLTVKQNEKCCNKCDRLDCWEIPRRCWPNGELSEQCATCQPCSAFLPVKSINPAEFNTAAQIMEAAK